MGRSRISWALNVVAPWCLGIGLVVSFTADAGQDPTYGASLVAASARAAPMPDDLVPLSGSSLRPIFGMSAKNGNSIRVASLSLGQQQDFATASDEVDPRIVMKTTTGILPKPDRSRKGDPNVGLRPTFDAKLRGMNSLASFQAGELLLDGEDYLAFDGFTATDGKVPSPDSVSQFEPWPGIVTPGGNPNAEASASPGRGGQGPTLRSPAPPTRRFGDGSTPAIPRAVALASTTPAPLDQSPVEIVAVVGQPHQSPGATRPQPRTTTVARSEDRPNYSSLVDQDRAGNEEHCLAETVYFEARSEPEEGQAAVAQVVLNRVKSGLYPNSICGVVFQNRHMHNACQFSFACEGKALRMTESESWRTAQRIAKEVLQGKTYVADVGGSTHYHANYVRPRWARALKKMDVIGHHIFYSLRPGQT